MGVGFRLDIMAITILCAAGTAAAQVPPSPQPGAPSALPGTPPRTPNVGQGANATPPVQLTAPQKSAIYEAISREKGKIVSPPKFQPSVGAEVPGAIELYALPPDAVASAQAASNFRYTIVNNDVVLVDPLNLRVVEIIRR